MQHLVIVLLLVVFIDVEMGSQVMMVDLTQFLQIQCTIYIIQYCTHYICSKEKRYCMYSIYIVCTLGG